MSIFAKLRWFFSANKKMYLTGIFFLILTDIMEILLPFVLGKSTDLLVSGDLTVRLLLIMIAVFLGLTILTNIGRYLWQVTIIRGAALLERSMRQKLYNHYLMMDAPFYQKHRTGELMALASNDISAIQRVAGGGILMAVDSSVVMILSVLSMVFNSSIQLTMMAVIPLPILAIIVMKLLPMIHARFTKIQEAVDEISNKTQESLKGIKAIKSLGQADADILSFEKTVQKNITANDHMMKIDALFDPVATIIMTISYIALIIIGGRYVLNDQMSLGNLIAFSGYLGLLVWPMFAIGQVFNVLERGNASYDRVMAVLDETSHLETSGIETVPAGDLAINVKLFSYPDDPEKVSLKAIKLTVNAGQSLGIVGPVGSGKTTLIKLLMRQFDHYDGEISMGGKSIRSYSLGAYRKALGYVPQENFLFSDTIAKNIAFARPNASSDEITLAAEKADLHKDILAMPDGYETQVGEQGISLSGGQRQRLAIARAILVNPELLILDDALSAVDAKTEQAILATLRHERRQKTTIILAHRMSSVASSSSQIMVMKDGEIDEIGSHDTLISKDGWYAQMYHEQGGHDNG
ncbi:ABC transporter ATP-binding protein [Lactococcus insecticola]|uniref:Multidrug ABC transporter permease/ATP-binding protein n=1 Tax=Pseudolactococcus insecticola TaxID=2709158 RepID=A0A6A0B8J4_9LACT|nr:ABC transporter transmembrane domain-containing protein [Lactococcus insecticola]GFH40751.1 multidrug ABC transporter permease/ATP-binding protein [Lactococcus insecticola]